MKSKRKLPHDERVAIRQGRATSRNTENRHWLLSNIQNNHSLKSCCVITPWCVWASQPFSSHPEITDVSFRGSDLISFFRLKKKKIVECNFGRCRSATFDTVTHCNTDEHLHLLPIQPREICFPSKLGLTKFVRKKKTSSLIGPSQELVWLMTSNSPLIFFQ